MSGEAGGQADGGGVGGPGTGPGGSGVGGGPGGSAGGGGDGGVGSNDVAAGIDGLFGGFSLGPKGPSTGIGMSDAAAKGLGIGDPSALGAAAGLGTGGVAGQFGGTSGPAAGFGGTPGMGEKAPVFGVNTLLGLTPVGLLNTVAKTIGGQSLGQVGYDVFSGKYDAPGNPGTTARDASANTGQDVGFRSPTRSLLLYRGGRLPQTNPEPSAPAAPESQASPRPVIDFYGKYRNG